jgi:hypothetical protein
MVDRIISGSYWATGWTAGGSGLDSRQGQDMSLLCTAFRPDLGVSYLQRIPSAGVKRQRRESDHSSPAS